MKKTFIDLFSGAGGMSCGLEIAGFQCLLGIDQDKTAIETFQLNHKQAQTIASDIRNISTEQIKEIIQNQKVDIICGGPPCQGFSTIGSNNKEDTRNFLFWEFIRIVEALNPDYILMENVTGILARKNEKTLEMILKCFTNLGYTVDIKVLSAHHYGVPEKRRRTIILGNKFGVANIYPEQLFKNSAEENSNLPLPRNVGWALQNLCEINGKFFNHDLNMAQIPNELEKKRIRYIPEGKSVRYEKDQLAYLPQELWFDVDWKSLHEERFREAKLNRLNNNSCSGTINTNRISYYHPTEDRYLTAREAAAIQSFPPDYIFCGTLTQQWKQIGNAVPPLLAKAIAQSILKLDRRKDVMEKTCSIQDVSLVRATAFSYKENVNEPQAIQLKLF